MYVDITALREKHPPVLAFPVSVFGVAAENSCLIWSRERVISDV